MYRHFIFLSILFLHFMSIAQPPSRTFPASLLYEKASPQLLQILDNPDTFRYQLIYTQIDRDRNNNPRFTHYKLRSNKDEYFNPASTVKMPLAFLALEKLHQMKIMDVDKNTPMLTDSAFSRQTTVTEDTSAANGLPSIAHYIKKIFLISDNDAYNRLYEFLGQQYINETLWKKGYKDIRITRRFTPMDEEENRHTNPIRFVKDGKTIYTQPPAYSQAKFNFPQTILIGRAHYNRDEQLVQSPMDFTRHNNAPLEDLQQIMQSVLFPGSVPAKQRFKLDQDDYKMLYRYMSQMPSESKHPKYDTSEYFDSYAKFLFKADRTIPSYIRVFNKTGWSYGFLTDISYVVDFKNNIEFMLSALIYVNSDGILNDDKYEYKETGYPFFKEVGNIFYEYELQRKRERKPDLSKFKISYTEP
ncbi:MAG: serine hydrolase [Sphingobacteriales bacterium]|nr:serine hydrolase [Sphingobacteriales bacterium]